MSNINTITDEKTLDGYLANQGKLIVLFYFDKNAGVCRQMHNELLKVAQMNQLTAFLVIDLVGYQGKPRFFTGQTPPYFVFYFNGGSMYNGTINNLQQLSQLVTEGQQKVMVTLNQQNQQNKMMMNNVQYPMNQPMYQNNNMQFAQPPIAQQTPVVSNQQLILQQMTAAGLAVPNFQAMQQMFIIFTNLQKMGIIPIPSVVGGLGANNELNINQDTRSTNEPQTLPDGTSIIPLNDGTYMLVEQNR